MQLAVTGENFEYDTYLLIREFCPEEKIVRLYEDTGAFYMFKGEETAKNAAGEEAAGNGGLSETGLLCEYSEEYTKILYYPGETNQPEEFCYPVNISKSDKKEYKKTHMGNLYRTLSKITGISLPWGDLTGVRPTKLARTMFESGASEEDVRKFYREGRFVSEEKSALAIEIAKRELEILKPIDSMNGYSLYIGIPFCPTR